METGGYLEIFDNSVGGGGKNKIFRVANFYVGDLVGNKEVPVPFMKEENNHEAYFILEKDEVRDIEGNLVNDETVVENGVSIVGNSKLPGSMPSDASKLYGKNILNFVQLITGKEGQLHLNFEDDLVIGTCVAHQGGITNDRVKAILG